MQAPWFYAAFTLILLLGGGLVASGVNRLSIAMGVVNALLLPGRPSCSSWRHPMRLEGARRTVGGFSAPPPRGFMPPWPASPDERPP